MKEVQSVHLKIAKSGQTTPDNFHLYYQEINSYVNLTEKTVIGEDFKCRFCSETDRAKFKKNSAHTFPEFTGNKMLFSKDECKDCNGLFSEYENEFANFAQSMRTLSGIKKKNKKTPKLKTQESLFQNLDGVLNLKLNRNELENYESKNISLKRLTQNGDHLQFSITGNAYKPIYLLKCLLKIALSIMPHHELATGNFDELKKWLLNKNRGFEKDFNEPYFTVLHNKIEFAKREPILILYKKRSNFADSNFASYVLFFGFGYHVYQCFLPYVSSDKWMNKSLNIDLYIIPEIMKEKNGKRLINFLKCTSFERISPKKEAYNVYKSK